MRAINPRFQFISFRRSRDESQSEFDHLHVVGISTGDGEGSQQPAQAGFQHHGQEGETVMLKIIVQIKSVDMNGFCGRDYHPTPDMTEMFARITDMETIHDSDDNGKTEYQLFHAILVDANGDDIPGEAAKIQLIDHEIESEENIPVLYGF
jgi:hypothetical protein